MKYTIRSLIFFSLLLSAQGRTEDSATGAQSANAAEIQRLQRVTNQAGALVPEAGRMQRTLQDLEQSNKKVEQRNKNVENMGNE